MECIGFPTLLVCVKLSIGNWWTKASFPSFIIMICHRLQTCISLYSGWRDQSRTVNRSSPFLPLYFAVAMWTLKKGLGRLAPLGNFGTDPLQVMFTKRQVEFTCYVNSAEQTKFLFFSCVVVSLSLSLFFPVTPSIFTWSFLSSW